MLAMLSHRTEGSIRRVPAAPTMDWTDGRQSPLNVNDLKKQAGACLLYVSSLRVDCHASMASWHDIPKMGYTS